MKERINTLFKDRLIKFFANNIMIVVCIVLIIICTFASPRFLTSRNIMAIFRQFSVVGVLAIGASIAIIVGGIDASLAAVMCFGVMVMGKLQHLPMPIIIICTLGISMFLGLITGLAVTKFRVVPFIATMAMATIAEGLAYLINDGKPIYWQNVHTEFIAKFGSGSIWIFPNLVSAFFILAIIGQLVLTKTKLGYTWRAIGGNEQAALWSGMNVFLYKILAYVFSSMMAGIGAVFMVARIGTSEPTAGLMWGMDVLAAAVLGGTVIGGGGKGALTGAILGAFILGMINNIFNLTGVSSFVQYVAKGIILLLAVIAGSHKFAFVSKGDDGKAAKNN